MTDAGARGRALIAIDGIDGSGKSTFARQLAAGLGAAGAGAVVLSVDDFRRPVEWGAAAAEADAYYDAYYDLAGCERCAAAFLGGASGVEIPQFDSVTERPIPARALALEGATVAVIEGVFPLRIPIVRELAVAIYLDVSPGEARRRILARDQRKGRAPADIARRIEGRYAPGQARYHAALDPRGRADVIVDNERPDAARCLRRSLARAPAELRAALDAVLPPGPAGRGG
jgi:uridine kinase